MGMFCYQCQETAKNSGCTIRGVCGKLPETANLQDLLLFALKGLAYYGMKAIRTAPLDAKYGTFIAKALFATITNANFDDERILALVREAFSIREELKAKTPPIAESAPECATWKAGNEASLLAKADSVGYLAIEDEDIRSLVGLAIFGLKGIAAYAEHAAVLGKFDMAVQDFFFESLSTIARGASKEELIALVLKTGETAVKVMSLLDSANTQVFGNPEITEVDIGVKNRPGILISGHDLLDLKELLEQSAGQGVDVYTHSEMLPAHYYPAFKNIPHFAGNYGNAWWKQDKEFESFKGPILMTTNCIVPVRDSYKDRIFTTGMTGYPGVPHIPERPEGGHKNFSRIIDLAKTCQPPEQIETGSIVGGFAHAQVDALAGKIVAAVKAGKIKRFVVMGGCDGRMKSREYFTEVASALPPDAVILTAGCAKYRYIKLKLGDIDGIPRVLDAGQCNDSYSLALTALKLKEAFGLSDVNELPLSFDIAWYEQKAVAVLLALISLGFKKIRIGPTLPGFLSPNIGKFIVDTFGLRGITTAEEDVKTIMAGA